MAVALQPPLLIESRYPPDQLVTASAGRRLGAYLLDLLIFTLTLFVGWLIWFAIVAPRGQSPGKQLVGLYIIRNDGTRAGGGFTWVREFLVKHVLFGVVISSIGFGIAWFVSALWLLWDSERQCLWDKVTETHIAYSPLGFRPLTADELSRAGLEVPARWEGVHAPVPAHASTPASSATQDVADELRELKKLHDEGLITDDEYEQRRLRLVERL
jgi:uncharacterized RDD family membrane protein YckC